MADKLDKARIKEVQKLFRQTEKNIASVRNTKVQLQEDIKRVYSQVQNAAAMERLRAIPVDELAQEKNGIRIAILKNAGITNIAQLVGMNKSRLIAINGIGLDSASKIIRIVETLRLETVKHCHVKIDPEDRSKESSVLVLSVCALLMAEPAFAEADRLEREYGEMLRRSVELVEPMTSSFQWLFTRSGKKKDLTAVYMKMEDLVMLGVPEKAADLWRRLHSFLTEVTVEQAWEHFEKNAASYYAYIEQQGSSNAG